MTATAASDVGTGLQGHYAGAVTRLAAFVIDQGIATAIFAATTGALAWIVDLVTDGRVSWNLGAGISAVAYVAWLFVYYAYPWAVSGKTVGMALIGIRVVRSDGSPVRPRGAALRTAALPLSFLTLGLGFLPILVGQHRRALHDRIAGTAVVYSWDARAARLRFLARQADDPEPAVRQS